MLYLGSSQEVARDHIQEMSVLGLSLKVVRYPKQEMIVPSLDGLSVTCLRSFPEKIRGRIQEMESAVPWIVPGSSQGS